MTCSWGLKRLGSDKVEALVVFGIGLAMVGGLGLLFAEAVNRVTSRFWIDTVFMRIMKIEYNSIFTIIFLVGVIVLVLSGVASHGGRVEVLD